MTCFVLMHKWWEEAGEHTRKGVKHATSREKDPRKFEPGSSCCDVTVLTTTPPCSPCVKFQYYENRTIFCEDDNNQLHEDTHDNSGDSFTIVLPAIINMLTHYLGHMSKCSS